MNAKGWLLLLVLLLIGGLIVGVIYFLPKQEEVPIIMVPPEGLEGQSIYASGGYGFTLVYPQSAAIEEGAFTNSYSPTAWRANALVNGTGTPILSMVTYATESSNSYPRHYVAAVRIGASRDASEIAACDKAGDSIGETALPDRTINGVVWKAFSFEDTAMMKYQKGVSYRVLRSNTCYALEALVSGSSYKDDAPSASDVSDEVLDAEYAKLDTLIASFAFTP